MVELFRILQANIIAIIYNCFTGKLIESYFTKGSQDQFFLPNTQRAARDVL